MKQTITGVAVEVVPWQHPAYTFSESWHTTGNTELAVIRVFTENGLEGNAFCGLFRLDLESIESALTTVFPAIKSVLVGSNAFDREPLYKAMSSRAGSGYGVSNRWINAFDIALWDLAGKVAGLPIYQLLGSCKDKVPAYASSPYYDEVSSYVEEALQYRDRGFQAYKIHPGGRSGAQVIYLCEEVRKAVGPDMRLMIDCGTNPFDFSEALQVGHALEDLKFYWYEDPLPFWQVDNLADLARRLDVPIALHDFTEYTQFPTLSYIQKEAGKIIRMDAPKAGITGLKKLATLCEAHGLKVEAHHGHNSLGNIANLHVILSASNCEFYEHIVPAEWHQFGLVEDLKVDSQGYVHAPEKPGLGFEVDWEKIRDLKPRILS